MTIKKIKDTMTPSLQAMKEAFGAIPKQGYDYFVSVTPKRTGNARRNTRLKGETIDANYAYAVPLDQGRSRQAPDGMSEPTIRYLKRLGDQAIRK